MQAARQPGQRPSCRGIMALPRRREVIRESLRSGASPRRSRPCRRRIAECRGDGNRAGSARSAGDRPRSALAPPPGRSSGRWTNSRLPQTSQTPSLRGPMIALVIAGAAARAAEPSGEPVDQRRLVDLDQDDMVEARARASASMSSSASACGTVRGKPSRTKPLAAIGLDDALGDHVDDDRRRRPAGPNP